MHILHIEWNIQSQQKESVIRYCPMCRNKVYFTDTGSLRVNANGKNRYYFKRFRCESGHTWSKPVKEQNLMHKERTVESESKMSCTLPHINIKEIVKENFNQIVIHLKDIEPAWRLDKLLAQTIRDKSRSQLVKSIDQGTIRINERMVKPKYRCSQGDEIVLDL